MTTSFDARLIETTSRCAYATVRGKRVTAFFHLSLAVTVDTKIAFLNSIAGFRFFMRRAGDVNVFTYDYFCLFLGFL